MLSKVLFSLLLLLYVPIAASAAEVKLVDVVAALETPFKAATKSAEQINNFQAKFQQRSLIASIGRTQKGNGTVSFSFTPAVEGEVVLAKFRWKYILPTAQEIISDGKTMWVYVLENRQVVISDIASLSSTTEQNPVSFLSGLGNLSKDFSIAWGESQTDSDGNYLLQLVPRLKSQFIKQIDIVVSKKAVTRWTEENVTGGIFPILLVTDPNDNKTSIKFAAVKVNRDLSEDIFTFELPEGVKVVTPSELGF